MWNAHTSTSLYSSRRTSPIPTYERSCHTCPAPSASCSRCTKIHNRPHTKLYHHTVAPCREILAIGLDFDGVKPVPPHVQGRPRSTSLCTVYVLGSRVGDPDAVTMFFDGVSLESTVRQYVSLGTLSDTRAHSAFHRPVTCSGSLLDNLTSTEYRVVAFSSVQPAFSFLLLYTACRCVSIMPLWCYTVSLLSY